VLISLAVFLFVPGPDGGLNGSDSQRVLLVLVLNQIVWVLMKKIGSVWL
jgi:hypothetical protein